MKASMTPVLSLAALLSAGTAGAQLPAYHGNAQRTGYSTSRGPDAPELKWRLDLLGEVISSPVIGPDGTIYVTASHIQDTQWFTPGAPPSIRTVRGVGYRLVA